MLPPPAPNADEPALLARARAGDRTAVAALYALHRDAALHLAQLLATAEDAEDLVEDSFTRVLARLDHGEGPETNFRGYLFAAIRNRHRDLQRRSGREEPVSDQPWLLEEYAGPVTDVAEEIDGDQAAAAMHTLPRTWQRVLLLLEVEERPIAEVAEHLGMRPAAVSSLAYRAREGLRTAYLDQRIRAVPAVTSECVWIRARLSRYVRAGLGGPGAGRIDAHLRDCDPCSALLAELQCVSRRFRFGRVVARARAAGEPGTDPPVPPTAPTAPAAGE